MTTDLNQERIEWLRQQNEGEGIEGPAKVRLDPYNIARALEPNKVLTTKELADAISVAHRSLHTWTQREGTEERLEKAGVWRVRDRDGRTNLWFLQHVLEE